MLMDDSTKLTLSDLKEQIRGYVGEEAAELAMGIAINAIGRLSIVGQPILDSLKDLKQKRVNERILEVLTDMNNQSKTNNINKDFFKSEEFQTLLALAVEQIATTHDKEKLHLLASALANSATADFSAESRKELFMRILRDLAPEHVRFLRVLLMNKISQPDPETLAILQPLVAKGLVKESFRPDAHISEPRFGHDWSAAEVKGAIRAFIKALLVRTYSITKFGTDFMKFLGESQRDISASPNSRKGSP